MRLAGILLIILGIAFCIPSATGQDVKGEVAAGFGGYYRIGKCMPVVVRLDNSGRDLTGALAIRLSRTSFTQTVTLPSPSRKIFASYVVPPKYLPELEVRLSAEGRILKVFTCPVQRVSDDEMLVVKSSTLRDLPASDARSYGSSQKEKTAFLDPKDFPESWNEYEAVNSVVLDSSDTIRLNSLQRTALSRWTLLGGRVTLLNRDQIAATPGQSAAAAAARTNLGLGSFGNNEAAGKNQEPVYQPSLMDLDEEIFKTMRLRNPMTRGGIVWSLGVFLLLYGSAIAFFSRIPKNAGKRKLWNLAVIPVIAVLFSILSPWIRIGVNAGNTMMRQYSIAHIFPNSADVFTASDISLLFARKGMCKLRPVNSSSYLVQNELENISDDNYYEFHGKGVPSAVFRADLWRNRLLSLADFSGPGSFVVLRTADTTMLVNRSKYQLRDCMWIRSGEPEPIGDMPAGRELYLRSGAITDNSSSPKSSIYGAAMLAKAVDVYKTETLAGMTGDCVICMMDGIIPSLESEGPKLVGTGSSAVVFHLGKHPAEESKLDTK